MAQQVRATEVCNEPSELTADVYETAGGEAYVIEVPVPGLRPDEISIELTVALKYFRPESCDLSLGSVDIVTVSVDRRAHVAGF